MNQDEFIKALKLVVHDATIRGVIESLLHPPGRRPRERLKRLSNWFNTLPAEHRQNVQEIIQQSVHAAVFNTLCVLDGVVAVESTSEKGELRLTFTKSGESVTLSGPEVGLLHDLYQGMVQDEVFAG
jgi:hypothetical protein